MNIDDTEFPIGAREISVLYNRILCPIRQNCLSEEKFYLCKEQKKRSRTKPTSLHVYEKENIG